MPATGNRDLAEEGLWQLSLERSQRRRILAAAARKEQNRRKTASLAVSAAVVAAPAWPSIAGSGGFQARADTATEPKRPEGNDRVLLSYGDRSPTVASLQRELRILEDGIFGPQTEAAVKAFQKRNGLPRTGDVDVKTWLALFPNDAIVAAPSADSGGEPGWTALTVPPAAGTAGPDAGVATPVSAPAPRKERGAKARAAVSVDVPSWEREPSDSPDAAPAPTAPAVGGPPPSGGGAPPVAPRPVVAPPPTAPRPVPMSPGGSVGDMINAMIREANRIDRARYSYRWGGGHNSRFAGPYDCSGAVSAVLHAGGLLKSPLVSGNFTRWGARGRGLVTIYANASHVYMSIKGRFFGTSRANPGGGAGWFRGGARSGFVVVHVPFERMKATKRKRAKRQRARIRMPGQSPRQTPQVDRLTGGTPAGGYVPPATTAPKTPAPAPQAPSAPAPAAPVPVAPAPTGTPVPPPATQPSPVNVTTPVGSVTLTPPQSGGGPAGGGLGQSSPTPTAPAEAQNAPAPQSAAGPAPGPAPSEPQAPPAPAANPVGEVAKDAVDGVGQAAGEVTSAIDPEPEAPPTSP